MKKSLRLDNGMDARFNSSNLKNAIRNKKIQLERSGEKFSLQSVQEDLAERTGISFSAIKHWCAGHNAPSDLDKVRDLATALDVDVDYLLEYEEEDSTNMNNNTISEIDYSSVKGTVRSIYNNVVDYIEAFRLGTITNIDGVNMKMMFVMMFGELMHAQLDIPKAVFDQIKEFSVNYLQQFGCYLKYSELAYEDEYVPLPDNPEDYFRQYKEAFECAPVAPWSEYLVMCVDTNSVEFERFAGAVKDQYLWDQDEANACLANDCIIRAAYERLAEILEDYMIK